MFLMLIRPVLNVFDVDTPCRKCFVMIYYWSLLLALHLGENRLNFFLFSSFSARLYLLLKNKRKDDDKLQVVLHSRLKQRSFFFFINPVFVLI